MLLSDGEIQTSIESGWIGYSPWDLELLNPASVDMRLHEEIRIPQTLGGSRFRHNEMDMRQVIPGHTAPMILPAEGYLILPGKFLLACTQEKVTVPHDLVARVEGKSSIGRVGLVVHVTAGFIDPGFSGQITLEMANLAPWPIRIYAGMRIGQIAFERMSQPASKPYGSVGHYQNQTGATESRYSHGKS